MVIQRNLDCDFPPGNEHNIPPNGKEKHSRSDLEGLGFSFFNARKN